LVSCKENLQRRGSGEEGTREERVRGGLYREEGRRGKRKGGKETK